MKSGLFSESSWIHDLPLPALALATILLILILYIIGRSVRNYRIKRDQHFHPDSSGAQAGAFLSLLYLLLSFTFSISLSRYDGRRTFIYQEATHIETAILRTELYHDTDRVALRKDLKDYVEARIQYYETQNQKKNSTAAIRKAISVSKRISEHVWHRVASIARRDPNVVRDGQMIPAVNEMIDVAISRDASRLARVPDLIVYLLITLTVIGGFIVGYGNKSERIDWVPLTLYLVMTVLTIYTILDLDRPKAGLIRSDLTHTKIEDLRSLLAE